MFKLPSLLSEHCCVPFRRDLTGGRPEKHKCRDSRSWQHLKEQSCYDQQGSSEESLKSEAAFSDLMHDGTEISGIDKPAVKHAP